MPCSYDIRQLHEPHDYYGGREYDWEMELNTQAAELHESNPGAIERLTSCVLDHLQSQQGGVTSKCELFSPQAIPWLWDIDMRMVEDKARSGEWGWHQLARRLAAVTRGTEHPKNHTMQLPAGLRNRRRIWPILEEARMNVVIFIMRIGDAIAVRFLISLTEAVLPS